MTLGKLSLFALFFFAALLARSRRLSHALTVSTVVMVGSLLLPDLVAIDLTGVPSLDKEAFTYAAAILAGVLASGAIPLRMFLGMEVPVLVLLTLSVLATVLLNPDPVMSNGILQESLGVQDLASQFLDLLIYIWLPFFAGRTLFRSFDALTDLLRALAIAGLGYGALTLLEILISVPFDSFQFACVVYDVCSIPVHRWGTIQPVLFMENVLSLAAFLAAATIAAAGLRRAGVPVIARRNGRGLQAALLACVVACKNVASILYSGLTSLAIGSLRPRVVTLMAAAAAALIFAYPLMRVQDLIPTEAVIDLVATFDKERMISLYGRFVEEEIVLDTMSGRFWFGWGTLDRVPDAMVFKSGEVHGMTGGDAGIDPYWVIVMGSSGMVGVALRFLLMLLPIVAWWRRAHRASQREQIIASTIAFIVVVRSADLILNGLWSNLPFFLAGALHGGARATAAISQPKAAPERPAPTAHQSRAPASRAASLAKRLKGRLRNDR